jgi:hypothetical protein
MVNVHTVINLFKVCLPKALLEVSLLLLLSGKRLLKSDDTK